MAEESVTPNNGKDLLEKFVPILLLVSVGLAFVVGMLWQKVSYLENNKTSTTNQEADQQQAPSVSLDQIMDLYNQDVLVFGDPGRKVTFVEVGDPSCPYCHIATGENPELNREVGAQYQLVSDGGTYTAPVAEMRKLLDSGEASFIWIYMNGHGNGELGAKALYCANEAGNFWPVHDLLMTNAGYTLLNEKVLNDVANAPLLAEFLSSATDSNQLVSCLQSGKYDDRLQADQDIARSLGVGGTPGFFINETTFAGAYSWDDIKPTVDALLN